MKNKTRQILEIIGVISVVLSLLFVGYELRQSTIQARASAFQAIGIWTSEWHLSLSERQNRLLTEADYPEAILRWTLTDWETYSRTQLSGLRSLETVLLQVDEGLLDPEAAENLGYQLDDHQAILTPGFECIWPELRQAVGTSVREAIDNTRANSSHTCAIDIEAVREREIGN